MLFVGERQFRGKGDGAMRMRMGAAVVGIAVLGLMATPGCVTKKTYRKNVEETDTRIKGVESGVETNEKRISDVASDTDQKITSVKGTAEKAVEIGNSDRAKGEAAAAQP